MTEEIGKIIMVYTKYDTPVKSIMAPSWKSLTAHLDISYLENLDCTEYVLTHIDHGLEGVRYFHYAGIS